MLRSLLPLILLLVASAPASASAADSLYSRAFGNAKDPAVVFLHGGPGYNCASFELSTAQRLADSGFFVIVFDQRGCGRSSKVKGVYIMDEALDDIHRMYKRHGIKRASLIGHSWGGTLGIYFALRYPDNVDHLVLTGSPLSYPRGFRTMLRSCANYYSATGDSNQLQLIRQLERADTTSLMFASLLFGHAAKCGLYKPHVVSNESATLKARIKQDTLSKLMQNMTQAPVIGFYKMAKYTTLDLTDPLIEVAKRTPVHAIYGEEDGLFDQKHLDALQRIISPAPIQYIPNASHNVFIDEPTLFITELVSDLRAKRP
jgi:proline iminopeptidase